MWHYASQMSGNMLPNSSNLPVHETGEYLLHAERVPGIDSLTHAYLYDPSHLRQRVPLHCADVEEFVAVIQEEVLRVVDLVH